MENVKDNIVLGKFHCLRVRNQMLCCLCVFLSLLSLEQQGVFAFAPNNSLSKSLRSHCSLPYHRSTMKMMVNQNNVLITFDLDDTLFPIGPVVSDANQALITHMRDVLDCPDISEQSFLASTKEIRRSTKVPITYTELRCRTIAYEMEKRKRQLKSAHSSKSDSDKDKDDSIRIEDIQISDAALEAYQIWELERHASAERNLFHDTLPMLEQLRSLDSNENSKDTPAIVIGAITNGKGNPFGMQNTLSPYFDFCVSGEDSDVFPKRKPDPGIYQIALQKYISLFNKNDSHNNNEEEDKQFIWIHVGDDLANDVGASATCGAFAVYAKLGDEYNQTARKRTSTRVQDQPSWSTCSPAELEKRAEANDIAKKSVKAEINCLIELTDVVDDIITNKFCDLKRLPYTQE